VTHVLTLEVKGRYAGSSCEFPHRILVQRFDIDQPVFYAELDVTVLRRNPCHAARKYTSCSAKYPSVTRDLAILVDERHHRRGSALSRGVMKSNAPLSASVFALSMCSVTESLGERKKSVAFTMTFQAEDSTLKDEDINASVNTIIAECWIAEERRTQELRNIMVSGDSTARMLI
jgi:phenylalanyl-tRNA synthetase beta chain